MSIQPEYRPQGGIGISEWDLCWAGVGFQVCEERGYPDRLGMCDLHYQEVTKR